MNVLMFALFLSHQPSIPTSLSVKHRWNANMWSFITLVRSQQYHTISSIQPCPTLSNSFRFLAPRAVYFVEWSGSTFWISVWVKRDWSRESERIRNKMLSESGEGRYTTKRIPQSGIGSQKWLYRMSMLMTGYGLKRGKIGEWIRSSLIKILKASQQGSARLR